MSKIPYVGFSNETLSKLPTCKVGDEFRCPKCGETHTIQPADDGSFIIGFYKCQGKDYLGAVAGHLVVPFQADESGKIDLKDEPKVKSETASFPIDIKHPQVIAFAKAMDEVLCKNDYKGGWDRCTKVWLRYRLMEELGEYFARLTVCDTEDQLDIHDKELAKKELIDAANFVMMIWTRS